MKKGCGSKAGYRPVDLQTSLKRSRVAPGLQGTDPSPNGLRLGPLVMNPKVEILPSDPLLDPLLDLWSQVVGTCTDSNSDQLGSDFDASNSRMDEPAA